MSVNSIREINDKYSYEDTEGSSPRDAELVSCGQCGNYNELRYIYKTKLESYINKGVITEQQALDALDSACSSLSNPRSRDDFYSYLSGVLGVEVKP